MPMAPLDASSCTEHKPIDPTPDEGPDPHQRPLEGIVRGPELWNTSSGLERLREVAREGYPTPVTRLTGIRIIDVADGNITCAMAASGWLTNYGGTIYGGAIALLGEGTTTAAVLSTLPAATACAPLGLNINLLRPVKPHPGEITACGRVVHRGRTIAIVHCEVSAEGKIVAIGNASVLILPGRSWDKPVHVAALKFSKSAADKIVRAGGSILSYEELKKKHPDGKGVRILG